MKRSIVLGVLVGVAVLSMAVVAQQGGGAQAPKVVDVEKLKDNLFVLRGANSGGNTAVFITSNGVVVVDAKNPGWGQPILDKIKTLTNKPVTTLINTHTHGDHVSGNVEFPSTVDIIVQIRPKGAEKAVMGFAIRRNERAHPKEIPASGSVEVGEAYRF